MKTKFLLCTALFILCIQFLSAQSDKTYLNAMVKSDINTNAVLVSVEAQPFQLVKLEKACGKPGENQSCVLDYIAKMKESGWEIVSSQNEGYNFFFFLRKKKGTENH